MIYWQLIERRFRNSDISFLSSLFGVLSGQYDYLDFNVHLWFLPCFFVTVIFYNMLVSIGGKKLAWIVSVLLSAAFIVVPLPPMPWGIDRTFKFIGFYAIGTVCTSVKMEEKIKEKSRLSFIVAAVLLAINFLLSYNGLDTGVMWFVTGTIGTISMLIVSVIVKPNKILEYLGRISLIVLCIHGPVYRVLIKIVSVPLRMTTDAVRENLPFALLVTVMTLGSCAVAYQMTRGVCRG